MIHRIIDIKADGLSVFDKESRRLLLCLEYCSMTIALVNKQTRQWTAVEVLHCGEEDLEDMEELMRGIQQQSALINYTGLDTRIFVRTPNTMMIPSYLRNDSKYFLDMQFGPEWDVVMTEEVNDSIIAALKTNSSWINPFKELFPQAHLQSSLGSLIRQFLDETGRNTGTTVLMVFSQSLVELIIVKNGQLLFAKCFRYNAVEDMNYQLLNICRQLNISPGDIQVKVQGLLEPASPLYESLQKYVGGIQFVNAATQEWGAQFKSLPAHYFTWLINAS